MKLFIVIAAAVLILTESALAKPASIESPVSWREQYAYSVGMASYPYVFPYFYMSQLRWMWITQARDPVNTPYMPINRFWHATHLINAKYQGGGALNIDTLYSTAWVNVSDEPIILSHPDMGDRYFTFQLAGFDSDNFAYAGQRATGSAAGHFAIVGPNFKGKLPQGVTALPATTTSWVLIGGRTMVDGEKDLPKVLALQKQYHLTPLSAWGKPESEQPVPSHDIWRPYKAKQDPLANWRTINRAMTENPPLKNESALLNLLAEVHIGPGQDLDSLDADSKRGLARAARDAHKMMLDARDDLKGGTTVNGWRRSPEHGGRMGKNGQYFVRGVTNFRGILANDPEETIYFGAYKDILERPLDASQYSYEITYAKGEEPPVDAFWSLALYEMNTNVFDNFLNRYAIGDRTQGLKRNDDGSLTIYIQSESPGSDKEPNWLPAPGGRFTMTMRAYLPQQPVIDGSWKPPVLKVIKK